VRLREEAGVATAATVERIRLEAEPFIDDTVAVVIDLVADLLALGNAGIGSAVEFFRLIAGKTEGIDPARSG